MNGDLTGRRVLVVGAARGLGAAVVDRLLTKSAQVAAVSRTPMHLEASKVAWSRRHPKAALEAIPLDMSVPKSGESLRHSLGVFDGLDGLVVCAGSGRPVDGSRHERMSSMMNTNVTPVLNALDGVESLLRQGESPSVVVVTSIAGRERLACPPEYAAAKAALGALVVHWAAEMAPIRVNAIAPGNILTDGSVWRRRAAEDPAGLAAFLGQEVPLRRVADPYEVADAALFLLSEASRFVSGSTLIVDGGQSRSFL